jgi:phage tail-like protein
MTAPRIDATLRPFTAFRFAFEVKVEGVSDKVCGAAFSEIDGLEMSVEPKTIREGGRNTGPIHLMGPTNYGQVTLKRGMTQNLDLWKWFARVTSPGTRGLRSNAEIVVFAADGATEQVRFVLRRILPVKIRAPSLNGREGQIAIEEMQIAFEHLVIRDVFGTAVPQAGA